jgi:hypothetical protein
MACFRWASSWLAKRGLFLKIKDHSNTLHLKITKSSKHLKEEKSSMYEIL